MMTELVFLGEKPILKKKKLNAALLFVNYCYVVRFSGHIQELQDINHVIAL